MCGELLSPQIIGSVFCLGAFLKRSAATPDFSCLVHRLISIIIDQPIATHVYIPHSYSSSFRFCQKWGGAEGETKMMAAHQMFKLNMCALREKRLPCTNFLTSGLPKAFVFHFRFNGFRPRTQKLCLI